VNIAAGWFEISVSWELQEKNFSSSFQIHGVGFFGGGLWFGGFFIAVSLVSDCVYIPMSGLGKSVSVDALDWLV